jgi:hypothetical protein
VLANKSFFNVDKMDAEWSLGNFQLCSYGWTSPCLCVRVVSPSSTRKVFVMQRGEFFLPS